MKLVLEVIAGPHQGKRFEFDGHENFLVGRAPDTHLQLSDDPHFSRHHFLLELNPPRCLLKDLNSRNGTFVNSRRVDSYYLEDGDIISGGRTRVRFRLIRTPDDSDIVERPKSDGSKADVLSSEQNLDTFQPLPDYALVRKIGEGKMGTVYHARHRESGKDYAVKIITPESSASPNAVNRFLREVSVLSQLNHPRIVHLHETGSASGMLFFVMDFVETVNIRDVLAGHSEPFKRRTYAAIIAQVLEGLQHAHSQGFVHRDIKPGNILLSRSGDMLHVKLADFGLAKNYSNAGLSGMTLEGELLGTCAFMPPEQILYARDIKPAADIYSCGATLYYHIANNYPHLYQPDKHPLATVLEDDPVPIVTRVMDLPQGLAEIIHTALARRPEDRFPSAEAMRQALLPFTK